MPWPSKKAGNGNTWMTFDPGQAACYSFPFFFFSHPRPSSARPSPRHSSSLPTYRRVSIDFLLYTSSLLPPLLWCLANFPSVIARQISRTRCWFSRFPQEGSRGMRGISGRIRSLCEEIIFVNRWIWTIHRQNWNCKFLRDTFYTTNEIQKISISFFMIKILV